MYCTTIDWGTPAYDDTVKLRTEVLRKPLKLEFRIEDLSKEFTDIHFVCYDDQDNLLACMVLVDLDGNQLKMRQVAVDPLYQNKGIGSFMVKDSEELARSLNFKEMVLNARDVAIPFYERMNYKKIGKSFTEVTIKHYKMVKTL